jgi:hypothetical protein
MVENTRGAAFVPSRRRSSARDLSRLAGWGLAALGALTLATYAASSEIGEDRLILAVANIRGVQPPERLARAPVPAATREFAESIRELSTDRDQLLARLDSLERNFGDLTGSITRAASPPNATPAAPPPALPPSIEAPEAIKGPSAAGAVSEDPPAARTEFGVDLGRANSLEGLRQLWTASKGKHGGALDGLRPVVAVREIARPGGVELRLVVGPLPNASAAARLCAALPGVACHPTVYDGQRLALR